MSLVISRSETTTLRFQRKNIDGEIITELPDEIYFTVKKRIQDDEPVLQKRLSTGGIIYSSEDFFYYIYLSVGDMDGIVEGVYFCDIKRVINDEEKFIYPAQPIKIVGVVTRLINEGESDG